MIELEVFLLNALGSGQMFILGFVCGIWQPAVPNAEGHRHRLIWDESEGLLERNRVNIKFNYTLRFKQGQ